MTNPVVIDPSDPLVLPVGHYVGAYYPDVGAPLKYRKLRLGVDIKRLPTDAQFGLWALSHGLPDRLATATWTRSALLTVAAEMELPDPASSLQAMLAQGTLVEVTYANAVEFARNHRIQPLMMGLGNTPQDPLTFSLGIVGLPPVVKVESFLYELWQWGRTARNLWQTVEMFAEVERKVVHKGAGVPDPEGVLHRILGRLHVLLAHNAVYLDRVLPELKAS